MSDNQTSRFKYIEDSYEPKGEAEHFNKKIEGLGLSIETAAALAEAGLSSVGDLCRIQMRHLYRIKALRKKNVFEVLRKLQSMQLDFMRVPKADPVEAEVAASSDVAVANANKQNNNLKAAKNNREGNQNNRDCKPVQNNRDGKPVQNNRDGKPVQNNRDGKPVQNNRDGKPVQNNRDGKSNVATDKNKANSNVKSESKWGKPNVATGGKSLESKWGKPNIGTGEGNNNQPRRDKHNDREKNNRTGEGSRERREKFDTRSGKPVVAAKGKQSPQDLGTSPTGYIVKNRMLKEERSKSIEKKISAIQPLKNEDGLYKFYRSGKWGYKDEKSGIVIEPTYTEAFNFREGMACVELDERCGFIDKKGEFIVKIKYDSACSFSEGLAAVTAGEKCAYIDKTGELVFPFEYQAATSFVNDIALVKKDGKWGYMDRHTGEIRLR